MGLIKMHSAQVGLFMNLVNISMPLKFHVVFDDMLDTVSSSIDTYTEAWIRTVMPRKPRIQVILDQ